MIKASAVDVLPRSKLKKGQVVNAVVVRLKSSTRRLLGHIRFDASAVVVLNEKFEPVATRLFGVVPRELKAMNPKVFNMARESA